MMEGARVRCTPPWDRGRGGGEDTAGLPGKELREIDNCHGKKGDGRLSPYYRGKDMQGADQKSVLSSGKRGMVAAQ
jgi:hypothetical protein